MSFFAYGVYFNKNNLTVKDNEIAENMGNTYLISYSVEKAICNMNLSVLQELGIYRAT